MRNFEVNSMEKKRELRVDLTDKHWEKLEIIKEDYGLFTYADMIRLMIKEKHDQIQEKKRAVDLSLKED